MTEVLYLVCEVRLNMQLGVSLRQSLEKFLVNKHQNYYRCLKSWLLKLESGQNGEIVSAKYPVLTNLSVKRALLTVFEKGIGGSPIDSILQDFEQELVMLIENEAERKIQLLPLKLLVPLTLFILPALVLLLLTPLLVTFGGL